MRQPPLPAPETTAQDTAYDLSRRVATYATAVGEAIGAFRAMSYIEDAKSLQLLAGHALQGLHDRLEELEKLND